MGELNLSPLAKTDLGPVGVALIEKLAAAVGVFGKPLGTVLQAHADAEAARIQAVGQVTAEAAALQRRAAERLTFEAIRNQHNLESIYGKTVAMLEPGIDPENVERLDDDWLSFHSERARLFSDDDMQTLFAKTLAEEVKEPGFFPRRTIQILSTIEKEEAVLFSAICNFVVSDKAGPTPAIFHAEGGGLPPIYRDNGITWDALYDLSATGLVKFTTPFLTDNVRRFKESTRAVTYFTETRTYRVPPINPPKDTSPFIHYGYVQFSDIGRRLYRIAGGQEVSGFFDYLESEWQKKSIVREAG